MKLDKIHEDFSNIQFAQSDHKVVINSCERVHVIQIEPLEIK